MGTKRIITALNTLGKHERLKSRKLIGQLFKEGKSISMFPFRALYLFSPQEAPLQAGFSVSSKTFKKAVDRNLIKRRMREAYRTRKQPLLQLLAIRNLHLAIFIIYTGKELPDHILLEEKMEGLLTAIVRNLGSRAAGLPPAG